MRYLDAMRAKYPLPAHPPRLSSVFQKLCQVVDEEELPAILKRVEQTAESQAPKGDEFLGPNEKYAAQLARCAKIILDQYDDYNDEEKGLAIGAVMYFIAEKDFIPDKTPIVGYDDDVRIMNHVLERLGFEDLFIDLDS